MKHKLIAFTIVASFVSSMLCTFAYAENTDVYRQYYVSVDGDNSNNGIDAPFRTIDRAIEEVRKVSDNMTGDIIVNIAPGSYYLDDMLRFYAEDSGKNGHKIIYRGEDMPVISGGVPVSGFSKSAEYENLWEVQLDNVDSVGGLYVNNKQAYVANSNRSLYAAATYNDPETSYKYDGLYVDGNNISDYENAEDIRLGWTLSWTFVSAEVESIERDATADSRFIVKMKQPYFNTNYASSSSVANLTDPFIIMNAFELLDTPGEYYFNKNTKKLYYFPREGEDMNTATAVIPMLDILMTINGNGVENPMTNVSFEGLCFAHTKNSGVDNTPYYASKQGQNLSGTSQSKHQNKSILTGAIEINHTENVDFKDSSFIGLGAVGLYMIEGVENSEISGNAFSDIGDAAIAIGHSTHCDSAIGTDGIGDTPPANAKLDLAHMAIMDASYELPLHAMRFDLTTQGTYTWGSKKFITEEEFTYRDVTGKYAKTWQGAPDPTEPQFIRYDFLDYYTVDKIMVAFDPSITDEVKRSNFEILLSNDPDFEDESTIVAVTQNEAANWINSYKVNDDDKFRYMLIRTIGVHPFAVRRVAVLSDDVAPYTDTARCRYIDISNNYIARAGIGNGVVGSGAGICSFGYEENISITHNEIRDLTYASIQLGYGWRNYNTGNKNHYVAYNRIEDICQILYDGGGIYTLSDQTGTVVEKNYMARMAATVAALYADQGTANMTFRDNVVIDVASTQFANTSSVNVIFENNFSTNTVSSERGDYGNVMGNINQIRYGDLPAEAQEIVANSGLEEGYEHIKNNVPDMKLNLPEERSFLANGRNSGQSRRNGEEADIVAVIPRVLEGEFGTLFGQYPESVKVKLNHYKTFPFTDTKIGMEGKVDYRIGVKEYLRNISVRRYSYDEMLEFCEAEISKARENCIVTGSVSSKDKAKAKAKAVGTYTKEAIDTFENKFKEFKNSVEDGTTTEMTALYDMEEAYNEFYRSILGGGFEAAFADDMVDSEIDAEAKTITFYMQPNDDLKGKKIELTTLGNSKLGRVLKEEYDLSEEISLPVYCPVLKTYSYWTIKTEYYKETGNGFVHAASNDKRIEKLSDTEVMLTPGITPYMKQDYKIASGKISVKPVCANKNNQFSVILGANSADELVVRDSAQSNDRFELVLDDNKSELYIVSAGVKTKIGETADTYIPNAWNTIEYSSTNEGNTDMLRVFINGKEAIHASVPMDSADGYMGILTNDFPVRAKVGER